MFNPKYQITMSECFPEENVICLGTQLISIVNALKDSLPQHQWYGADVEAMGKNAIRSNVNGYQIGLIGTDEHFIQYCTGIDQFIWGVFLCIDHSFASQDIQDVEVGAEDERFRPIACNGVLLEIRTFDTTFFRIYSEDKAVVDVLSRQFQPIEVTHNESL